MLIRIRWPSGLSTVTLADDATVQDLRNVIGDRTGLTAYDVKYGYPPQPLSLDHAEAHQKLADLRVQLHREQLIIAARDGAKPEIAARNESAFTTTQPSTTKLSLSRKRNPAGSPVDEIELPSPEHGGTFLIRVMPDDNSCMFRAVSTALAGGEDLMVELRSIVAQTIQEHPERWSDAMVGGSRDDYCRSIQKETTWGGGIDLAILAQHFNTEICTIDLSNLNLYNFNEGQSRRCFLVYSGVHYDTIALAAGKNASPEYDVKVFDAADDRAVEKAKALCRLLKEKAPDYNVNPNSIRLKCNVCGSIFVGQKAVQGHGELTGHSDFEQVSS
ncbi:hypothetical protein BJY04DRAFT_39886 [Aspergillus karnatakaensis]|uniref:ubiquitin-specific protease OTU1 n=1 Tax=Aspergillus karnatakaensis TaxID=1810916 RepID=UPI003CCCB1E6